MTEVLKMSRKALTVGIVLSTVLWSMMASVLVAPLKASAAGCTSGSLIKGSLAAVYYCGSDGKRYVFTNDRAYKTWYADFSSVTTISDADLASIQIGGNVTYRPGVKMVKIVSDPKVYAVAHGGVLRHVPSEACAVTLYGTTWNTMIDDVSDAFFTNYSIGTPINAACTDFNKTAEMSSSQTINADKNLSTGGGVSGSASVSLASDNPAGATLPQGAMGVNFLKFNLTNTGSAMTVDSITLRRVGPGNPGDIEAVYLYEGSTRLTSGRSVNSSTNEVTYTGLNLSLGANQTRALWVSVDLDAGSTLTGNVHAFEVLKALSGSTQLSGSSVRGNNFTISGAEVGSLSIDAVGTITDPKVGEMEAKVGEFRVDAGTREDVRLKRITLFQGGNLSASNITNLKLKQAGLTVATASGFDSGLRATFVMSEPGMLLEKGASKTFQVYADIGGTARAGDEIELYVEEDADVFGTGQTYGYGVLVDRSLYDGTNGNASVSEIEAGQLTLNLLGPASKDIAVDGNDVEVLRFSALAQSNIEIRNLNLNVEGTDLMTSGSGNISDIKIQNVSNGANWWGPEEVDEDDGADVVNFDSAVSLQAGVLYTFSVTVDIEDGAQDADTLRVSLLGFDDNDIRNLDNSTFLDGDEDIVPANGLVGNQMTIRTSSLTTSLGSTPVSQTYIKGSTNIDFLGINLKAGDAASVTLNSITATGFIDEDGGTSMLQGMDNNVQVRDIAQTCRLKDGTTQVGQSKSPSAGSTGGKLEFTGLNLVIAAGQTKSLRLNCDVSNSAFVNGNAERIGFSIQTAADVVAQDADGNNVNPIGNVNPTAGVVRHLIQNTGTMSYTLAPDDTESEAGLVIAGNGSVVLGKIRLTAANEELKQTKIRVSLVNGAASSSVNSMSLYDGSTLVAGPVPLSGPNADFSGFNFVVPKDGSKTLTVKAALNTISNGAVSGSNLQITTDLTNPTTGTFEYRGTSSSTVATDINTADLTGRVKVLRKTKPTVSLASLPTSTLSNGTMVLSRVTITADAAEQVSLKTIAWTVNKSDADIVISNPTNQSAMREVGQGSHISGTATLSTCGSGSTNCRVTSTFSNEQVIAAGTSKTYELVVLVAGAVDDNSISTSIAADSGVITNSLDDTGPGSIAGDSLTGSTDDYNFIWSDNSAIPHNDTLGGSADWTNGLYVKVLPTDSQTVLF